MPLNEYIDLHYAGNKTHFAKANGVLVQQVQQQVKHGAYHVIENGGDNYLVILKSKVQ